MDQLIHQAGLPHARLAYHGDDLGVSSVCLRQGLMHRLQFGLAPDKGGEASRRRGLQAPAQRTGPHQLTHLDRFARPLTGTGPSAVT